MPPWLVRMYYSPCCKRTSTQNQLCFLVVALMTVFETATDAQTTRLHSQMDPSAILARAIGVEPIFPGSKPDLFPRLGTPLHLAAGVRLELTSFSVNSGVLSPGKLTSKKLFV